MNWKLVLLLSLFGLAMGVATVFLIPGRFEPLFWLVIFGISAYAIAASTPGKHFQHGLVVGIANCVWVTGTHLLLFESYLANHPREAAMMASMPLPDSPRLMMILVGPVIGVLSGCLIGLLALLAGRFVGPGAAPAAPAL